MSSNEIIVKILYAKYARNAGKAFPNIVEVVRIKGVMRLLKSPLNAYSASLGDGQCLPFLVFRRPHFQMVSLSTAYYSYFRSSS